MQRINENKEFVYWTDKQDKLLPKVSKRRDRNKTQINDIRDEKRHYNKIPWDMFKKFIFTKSRNGWIFYQNSTKVR